MKDIDGTKNQVKSLKGVHAVKNKIYNLIQKYWRKYPAWIFKWLVRKHWLFPEPQVLYNRIWVSDSDLMRISPRELEYEVKKRLIEEVWENILKMYVKYSYSPSYREVHIDQSQDFESNARILTLRVECRYNPNFTYGQMRDFIQEIESLVSQNGGSTK